MKELLLIVFFFLQLSHTTAQITEKIAGEYVFKEEIGIHSYGPYGSFGNLSYCSPLQYVDTTVLHKLCLNATHGAFLERDTIQWYLYFGVNYQWLGNLQFSGDSLVITFDRLMTTYAFTVPGYPSVFVENLPEPIITSYLLEEIENVIYLLRKKDDERIVFRREEYE